MGEDVGIDGVASAGKGLGDFGQYALLEETGNGEGSLTCLERRLVALAEGLLEDFGEGADLVGTDLELAFDLFQQSVGGGIA